MMDLKSLQLMQNMKNSPKQDFSFVVILGAPESANDDLLYLRAEQELIKSCVEKNTPVLGICLGSQLIAKNFLVLMCIVALTKKLDSMTI